jgi:hypothetical protein
MGGTSTRDTWSSGSGKSLTPRLCREEGPRFNDGGFLNAAEAQEVMVAGDNHAGLGMKRAIQDPVHRAHKGGSA